MGSECHGCYKCFGGMWAIEGIGVCGLVLIHITFDSQWRWYSGVVG